MSYVTTYLQNIVTMSSSCNNSVHGYSSLEEFVMRYGRSFTWAPGRKIKLGIPKQCYRNAAKMTMRRKTYVYVEGLAWVACAPIPVWHAWCVDRTGMVVDPTWDEKSLPGRREYFGIPIKRKYLYETAVKLHEWGCIDDWGNRWPMLTKPESEWLEGGTNAQVQAGCDRDASVQDDLHLGSQRSARGRGAVRALRVG